MLWDFQGMEEPFQIRCSPSTFYPYNDLLCHFNSNEYQFVDVQCILQLENFKNTFNVDAYKKDILALLPEEISLAPSVLIQQFAV